MSWARLGEEGLREALPGCPGGAAPIGRTKPPASDP